MHKKLIPIAIVLSILISGTVYAKENEESYLRQILNQLDAMQLTVLAAKKEQIPNTRLQFHYTRYQNAKGEWHSGLLEDIKAIKSGIEERLKASPIEPKGLVPIKGDYIQ